MAEQTKEDERWASRGLVAMLIREMKDYKAAAEIVSDSDDVFAMCSRQIGDAIARIQEIPTAVSALELQQILRNVRAEIEEPRKWQNEVIASLPPRDDAGRTHRPFAPGIHEDRNDTRQAPGRSYASGRQMVEGAGGSVQC
ncbi:MAG TPA: hypothetical protein V6D17_05340 [Candidatus Obscuribacterales bacterium]